MALRSSYHRLGYGGDCDMNVVVDYGQVQDIFLSFVSVYSYGFDDMPLHNWMTDKSIKNMMTLYKHGDGHREVPPLSRLFRLNTVMSSFLS